MKTNEKFLEALQYMNATMKADNNAGHQWKYCNVTKKKVYGFENKRKAGKYLTNCVDGVQDALRIAGVKATAWYGGNGKIVWLNDHAKSDAKKYFNIISTGGKTVNQLYKEGQLCDGDILMGYQGFSHTNCYYGGTKSFDSGHAYCSGSGEGAKFKKWIGAMTYKTKKVNYILRLKDRAHYRVQAGAYTDINKFHEQAALLRKKGFSVVMLQEEGMYKAQVGHFAGKSNAERLLASLSKKGFSAFIKEV